MGEVFFATDLSTGAPIALKRMLGQSAQSRSLVVHFMREYHALSELLHPRIVTVYDYGVDGDTPYYTMELLDGQDLHELSPIPYREACLYLRDIASSLALLHARRLLHRDVSPRNVRRTSDGHCKLLDFGTMVPFGLPPNIAGTPPCIAPEVLHGAPLDQRSDLFSLGAVAYFVLSRRHAFAAPSIDDLPYAWSRGAQHVQRIAESVPDALNDLVMSLLSEDPLQRPSSAAEVIERLSAIADLEPDGAGAIARSFLSGSKLMGRDAERRRLQQRLSETRSGRGSVVLVGGEPGSGRSRMLGEAARLGQTNGLTVVRVVARPQRGAAAGLLYDLAHGLLKAAPREARRASASRPWVAELLAVPQADRWSAAENSDNRAELLDEVNQYIAAVGEERPLLITVDDLDRADDLSAAAVAGIALKTNSCPITLVASHRASRLVPLPANVRANATVLTLQWLAPIDSAGLVSSLFGDAPKLERLAHWLFRAAAGSPKLTLQIAEHLLEQGVVRYIDGIWVLPDEIEHVLPPSAADALRLRLDAVSGEARRLAELLSVSRSGVTAARVIDLAQEPAATVVGALDELVRVGVLESARDEYVFAQDGLRKSLASSIDSDLRRTLHLRWAERLLASTPSQNDQLEAGWHLTETEQEMRGAAMLAKFGPEFVERRVSMGTAVPAIERALEIYERRGRPLADRLYLRSLLVLSGYLFDHRLADRYAEATLDALYPFTGMPEVERASRWFGKWAGFWVGCTWAIAKRWFRSEARRGPTVFNAARDYSRALMACVGLSALTSDVAGTRAALQRMRAFENAPHPSLSLVYTLAKAITLHGEGMGPEIAPLVRGVVTKLDRPGPPPHLMSHTDRVDLLVGILLLDGINECYRAHSEALTRADRIERFQTPIAEAAALRIRMTHHSLRGETERAQYFRSALDLHAIHNGAPWQSDWIALPLEVWAGAIMTDLVMMRRSLETVEKLVVTTPSFSNVRDAARVAYHFGRGDYAAVIECGEDYIRAHPPMTLIGWPAIYAKVALAYVECEQPERALAICQRAWSHVPNEHLAYIVHYNALEAAYATTLAVLGERERADDLFRNMLARLRASGEHVRAFLAHEWRVKVARLVGDRAGLRAALSEMREVALASGSSSVIAMAQRIEELSTSYPSAPPPVAAASDLSSATATKNTETIVTAFLRQQTEGRADHALHMIAQFANTSEGYLFRRVNGGELLLAATLDSGTPPIELQRALAGIPANDQRMTLPIEVGGGGIQHFAVVRLMAADGDCAGLVALRENKSGAVQIPRSLATSIGQAL